MAKKATIQCRPLKVAKDFWRHDLVPFLTNVIGRDWHRKATYRIEPERSVMLIKFKKMGSRARRRLMSALKQHISNFPWVSLIPSRGVAVLRFNF